MGPASNSLEYYVVLDFEATCDDASKVVPQEVIEYPSVLLCAKTLTILDEFRSLVRPQHNPELTPFCQDLTGITQEQVDGAPSFPAVYSEHLAWLRNNGLRVSADDSGSSFAFILCGDWDLMTMFPAQCGVCDPPIGFIPHAFRSWINIKRPFAAFEGVAKAPGMAGMLRSLQIELTGRHHCGIDDCRNIAKIVQHLAEAGVPLEVTTELPASRYPPVNLLLSHQSHTEKITLKRRSMSVLFGLAGSLFRKRLGSASLEDGRELREDADLHDLADGAVVNIE